MVAGHEQCLETQYPLLQRLLQKHNKVQEKVHCEFKEIH